MEQRLHLGRSRRGVRSGLIGPHAQCVTKLKEKRLAKTRVLGIDPGTAITGFGLLEADSSTPAAPARLCECGVIRTASGLPMSRRLAEIHSALSELIAQTHPDVVVVEELFFSANVSTAITVGQARGVVLLAAAQSHLPVYEYAPNKVKQAVTGDGGADKRQMQDMLRIVLGLDRVPRPDDAADAVATALAHVQMGRFADLDRRPG
jgi:crossover junction endodeoxyribonuclease RuvC